MNSLPAGSRPRGFGALTLGALLVLGAGCSAERSLAAPAASSQAPPPDDASGDRVYVAAPPSDDMEAHPFAFSGGVAVYYVDGHWYRHGPRGWSYYRREPPDLFREREARWERDHQPGSPGSRQPAGVTESQPPDALPSPTGKSGMRAIPAPAPAPPPQSTPDP